MASKILVDELAPQSHATDVTLTTGKKIAGANTQFKITGGSANNHLETDGSGNLTWTAPPIGGLGQASVFSLQSNHTINTSEADVTDWAVTNATAYTTLGTSPTYPLGIFTFPQTGFYLVLFQATITRSDGSSTNHGRIYLQATVNDSTFTHISEAWYTATNNEMGAFSLTGLIDVTDISTVKCKFTTEQDSPGGTQRLLGTAAASPYYTTATFIRLAGT